MEAAATGKHHQPLAPASAPLPVDSDKGTALRAARARAASKAKQKIDAKLQPGSPDERWGAGRGRALNPAEFESSSCLLTPGASAADRGLN